MSCAGRRNGPWQRGRGAPLCSPPLSGVLGAARAQRRLQRAMAKRGISAGEAAAGVLGLAGVTAGLKRKDSDELPSALLDCKLEVGPDHKTFMAVQVRFEALRTLALALPQGTC